MLTEERFRESKKVLGRGVNVPCRAGGVI